MGGGVGVQAVVTMEIETFLHSFYNLNVLSEIFLVFSGAVRYILLCPLEQIPADNS